jgi:hypothetical protein
MVRISGELLAPLVMAWSLASWMFTKSSSASPVMPSSSAAHWTNADAAMATVVRVAVQFFFTVVKFLGKTSAELFESLGIAVGAGVLALMPWIVLTRLETLDMDYAAFCRVGFRVRG